MTITIDSMAGLFAAMGVMFFVTFFFYGAMIFINKVEDIIHKRSVAKSAKFSY